MPSIFSLYRFVHDTPAPWPGASPAVLALLILGLEGYVRPEGGLGAPLAIVLAVALACHDGNVAARRAYYGRWFLVGVSWPMLGLLSIVAVLFRWCVPVGIGLLLGLELFTDHTATWTLFPALLVATALATILQALFAGRSSASTWGVLVTVPLLIPMVLFFSADAVSLLWGQALLWLALSPWVTGLLWHAAVREVL
jgi:hypothetical protein